METCWPAPDTVQVQCKLHMLRVCNPAVLLARQRAVQHRSARAAYGPSVTAASCPAARGPPGFWSATSYKPAGL